MRTHNVTQDPEELNAIEEHLAGTLKRVSAPQGFVKGLRQRIRLPHRSEIVVRLRDWQTLLVVFGGVISGAMVILTVARALFHLVGRRNIG